MMDFCDNFQDQDNFSDLDTKSKLNGYLSNIECFNSSEKIIDIIESNRNNIKKNNYFMFYRDISILLRDIKRKLFNKNSFMKNLSEQKFSNISISEIKDIIQHIDDLNKYKITKFKTGLIDIKLK